MSPRILRRYRSNWTQESLRRGNDVTFAEFISYVIDARSQRLRDFHWAPQTAMCQPCRVRYDFVGHFETLRDDARYVIDRIGLASRVQFPSTRPNRSARYAERRRAAFATVPTTHIARLTEIYFADFAAFGYDVPSLQGSNERP